MTRLLALIVSGLIAAGASVGTDRPDPIERAAPCAGAVVTAPAGVSLGCDLNPPTRLDLSGLTRAQCDRVGGTYVTETDLCRGVDY